MGIDDRIESMISEAALPRGMSYEFDWMDGDDAFLNLHNEGLALASLEFLDSAPAEGMEMLAKDIARELSEEEGREWTCHLSEWNHWDENGEEWDEDWESAGECGRLAALQVQLYVLE